jgi:hypothetical protein
VAIAVPQKVHSLTRVHLQAAITSMVLAAMAVGFLMFDRRVPFEYLSTEIVPRVVYPGQSITVWRHVYWHRQCEGEAWTEIVSETDRIITFYDRGSRYPAELGDTRAQRTIQLPQTLRPGGATYRGTIRFTKCGITSRWSPIIVPYQEVTFEVR